MDGLRLAPFPQGETRELLIVTWILAAASRETDVRTPWNGILDHAFPSKVNIDPAAEGTSPPRDDLIACRRGDM